MKKNPKEEAKLRSCMWWLIGLILLFLSFPIIWFGAFVLSERSYLRVGVDEFNQQTYKKDVFKESHKILLLSEFIEKNKISLVGENCLELPKDTIKLIQQQPIKNVVDSLLILLKKIKTKNILAYKFCKPKYSGQSHSLLSTEINLKSERLIKKSRCKIEHYIYSNMVVRTSSNPERVYAYNDLERDTFFIGTFRYSIRIRPNSL